MDEKGQETFEIRAPIKMSFEERSILGTEISELYLMIKRKEEELKVQAELERQVIKGLYAELGSKSMQLKDGQIFKPFVCTRETGYDKDLGEIFLFRDIKSKSIVMSKPIDKSIFENSLGDPHEQVTMEIVSENVPEQDDSKEESIPSGEREIVFLDDEVPTTNPDEDIF